MTVVSEICKDGLVLRIIEEGEATAFQVSENLDHGDDRRGLLPIDPDVMCAVLRGMTYQIVSKDGFCTVRRSGPTVVVEFEMFGRKHRCELSAAEFSQLIAPVIPPRMRALLM